MATVTTPRHSTSPAIQLDDVDRRITLIVLSHRKSRDSGPTWSELRQESPT
jgi:hypothetical protein